METERRWDMVSLLLAAGWYCYLLVMCVVVAAGFVTMGRWVLDAF